ncbi:ArsR family transcriptional regulator [Streptomyces camelliae]|uniref:Helix-turn-helix domain-containing protein n=1 Tax=Streptomyces camelliae TaxID=3004093 RepID=A0ABY7P2I3_9ACTN|nr:ArsR family transcriptional regulator [Streptomyces sp. HUAS 2-6]WBO64730.1 helix-turn-helix domain-containing protein [Streptomyces sp. HUAS 2-6]
MTERDTPGGETGTDGVLDISAPEQFAALAHPLRQRLLFALTHEAATISQLAVRLGVAKGSVAHHLKTLHTAGLVHIAETRTVRGGTEHRYRRTGRRLRIAEPRPADRAALLNAVAQEVDRSPDEHLLSLRHLRLTPERARRLRETLAELVDGAQEDGPEQPVHGVLVVMYEQERP